MMKTKRKRPQVKLIRVVVAAINAGGEPDLYFCKVYGPERDYNDGLFYQIAKDAAEDSGYEDPMVAFDENDHAGRALMGLFQWETATTYDSRKRGG